MQKQKKNHLTRFNTLPQQILYRRNEQQHTMKAINDRFTANIILSGEKLKTFPLWSGKKKNALSHHFYSNITESPSQASKWNKRHPNQKKKKKKVKLSVPMSYIMKILKNLLEQINNFSKVVGHQITYKSQLYFQVPTQIALGKKSRK